MESVVEMIGIPGALFLGLYLRKTTEETYVRWMGILGGLLLLSEIAKQLILTFVVNGGHYQVWYFPFQLCSLPMYLCTAMPVLSVKNQRRVQVFLMDFTLLGALAVFYDTSGMYYSLPLLTVHSFLWHLLLILIGCWSGCMWAKERGNAATESRAETWNDYKMTLPLWGITVVLATIFNVFLWRFGEINMFYISPFEASTQVIIRDVAAKCGIRAGNLLYLLAMAVGAAVLHSCWIRLTKGEERRG